MEATRTAQLLRTADDCRGHFISISIAIVTVVVISQWSTLVDFISFHQRYWLKWRSLKTGDSTSWTDGAGRETTTWVSEKFLEEIFIWKHFLNTFFWGQISFRIFWEMFFMSPQLAKPHVCIYFEEHPTLRNVMVETLNLRRHISKGVTFSWKFANVNISKYSLRPFKHDSFWNKRQIWKCECRFSGSLWSGCKTWGTMQLEMEKLIVGFLDTSSGLQDTL